MTDGPIKYFRVEEANKTLPYVGKIVRDIVAAYEAWRDGVRRYELVAANSRSDVGETTEQIALRENVDRVAMQINRYLGELATVGCVLKGFDDGLVDFYAQLDGRDIFLCWKLGENEIRHWHEIDAGYAGRRQLVPELVERGPE